MAWLCYCGLTNFGRNKKCAKCKLVRPEDTSNPVDELEIKINEYKYRRLLEDIHMTPNEERHAAFFNKGTLHVKDMKDNEIRTWQDEMAEIAAEARAMILAGDAELRRRGAAKKSWVVNNDQPDPNVTNAINLVRKKNPVSKADKLREDMIKLGMDPDAVDKLMVNVVAPDKSVTRPFGPKYKLNGIPEPVDETPKKTNEETRPQDEPDFLKNLKLDK